MAFAISTPTSSLVQYCCSSSSSTSSGVRYVEKVSELGFGPFSHWNGLKQVGISISNYSSRVKKERKGKGRGIYASLFGVGAPEALVIGVVALLVFGPKGLAEVARNLGKTLRGFQPTIRELQEVSREFKSTLEREIGLDEVNNPVPTTPRRFPTPEDFLDDSARMNVAPKSSPQYDESDVSGSGAYTADEYLKVTEAQLIGAVARVQKEREEGIEKAQSPSQGNSNALQEQEEAAASVLPPAPVQKPGTDV